MSEPLPSTSLLSIPGQLESDSNMAMDSAADGADGVSGHRSAPGDTTLMVGPDQEASTSGASATAKSNDQTPSPPAKQTPAVSAPEQKIMPEKGPWRKRLDAVFDWLLEQWFILGLGFAIGFAAAVPDFGRTGGWIRAEYTIKYGAVIIIFFLSGLSLKTRVLMNAAGRLHVHTYVQAMCLALTPALGYGISRGLQRTSMDMYLTRGLVIAMCMPTTISTNVVFTKQAGGNEALALVNAVVGNVIGIFVSPGWLQLYLGAAAGGAPVVDVFQQLGITVIAPLVVGQVVQFMFEPQVKVLAAQVNFGKVSNCMIILLVWSTFCNTFHSNISVAGGDVAGIFFLMLGLFLLLCVINLGLATLVPLKQGLGLDKADAVSLVMCCSTKTLALGAPLIVVLYGKNSNVGLMALPLLMYHAQQCLIGALLVKPLRRWVEGPSTGAWPQACISSINTKSTSQEQPLDIIASEKGVSGSMSGDSEGGKGGEGVVEGGLLGPQRRGRFSSDQFGGKRGDAGAGRDVEHATHLVQA